MYMYVQELCVYTLYMYKGKRKRIQHYACVIMAMIGREEEGKKEREIMLNTCMYVHVHVHCSMFTTSLCTCTL